MSDFRKYLGEAKSKIPSNVKKDLLAVIKEDMDEFEDGLGDRVNDVVADYDNEDGDLTNDILNAFGKLLNKALKDLTKKI